MEQILVLLLELNSLGFFSKYSHFTQSFQISDLLKYLEYSDSETFSQFQVSVKHKKISQFSWVTSLKKKYKSKLISFPKRLNI